MIYSDGLYIIICPYPTFLPIHKFQVYCDFFLYYTSTLDASCRFHFYQNYKDNDDFDLNFKTPVYLPANICFLVHFMSIHNNNNYDM